MSLARAGDGGAQALQGGGVALVGSGTMFIRTGSPLRLRKARRNSIVRSARPQRLQKRRHVGLGAVARRRRHLGQQGEVGVERHVVPEVQALALGATVPARHNIDRMSVRCMQPSQQWDDARLDVLHAHEPAHAVAQESKLSGLVPCTYRWPGG